MLSLSLLSIDCWWPFAWVAFTAVALYVFSTSTFGYWHKRNVPYVRLLVPLFGNSAGLALGVEHQIDMFNRLYRANREQRYVGIFQMRTPLLLICDPELVNRVLIQDSANFSDRGIYKTPPEISPLSNNLFTMTGAQWKSMRSKLSPAFTPGKLKLMYGQIKECSEQLMRNLACELDDSDGRIEVRDVLGKYSTDVIGTCAFGLQLNAINEVDSGFRKYGKSIFTPSIRNLFRDLSWMISPVLRSVFRISDYPWDAVQFFKSAFIDTMKHRQEHGVIRNDLMQALIQARTDLVVNRTDSSVRFEEMDIVANAFIMFAAGFETVSTAISFCLYELALKKPIQDRVRAEINSMKAKHDNEINSDFLMDLHYLEMVLAETLRKYPPLITLIRKSKEDYPVPNDILVIEKDIKVLIPVYALHYDHRYYPDPQTFDPERFSLKEKAKRPNGTYMPFGDGPRICIGKRFAEMEMKLALTELLTKYEVEPCEKTDIPMIYSKKSIILMPKNGIWLTFKPI